MKSFKKDVVHLPREAGCQYERPAKGSHEWWYSPITGRRFVASECRSRHTANETLKQAGLSKAF